MALKTEKQGGIIFLIVLIIMPADRNVSCSLFELSSQTIFVTDLPDCRQVSQISKDKLKVQVSPRLRQPWVTYQVKNDVLIFTIFWLSYKPEKRNSHYKSGTSFLSIGREIKSFFFNRFTKVTNSFK